MTNTPGTFAYPGSKTTLASWIIDYFPKHTQYIEAFGGAGSVLVAKGRSDLEVYNDLNGDCVQFFKAVRDEPLALERWVRNTPYSRELFDEYVDSYPDWPNDTVQRAGRFLYVSCASFGGKTVGVTDSPTFGVIGAKSYRGNDGDKYEYKWCQKAKHIRQLKDRLKGVNIECLDYANLVEKYDHPEAFFYFDPPYQHVGDDYYQVEDGGFDHERFVATVRDMDGRWLVSYDQNIPDGLGDYQTVQRTKKATISVDQPEKAETLTMNYDPNQTAMFSEPEQQTL